MGIQKKIHAFFYKSKSGNEPVRNELIKLGRPVKTEVGADISFVELNWKVDRPYVDQLRTGTGKFSKTIYEVRTSVNSNQYRTLFFVYKDKMILCHFLKKTTQKVPKAEIDIAWNRMKEWVAEEVLRTNKK